MDVVTPSKRCPGFSSVAGNELNQPGPLAKPVARLVVLCHRAEEVRQAWCLKVEVNTENPEAPPGQQHADISEGERSADAAFI
ncbi:hypothetical protein ABID25_006092 [Mesorhizobium abyssinicae]